MAFTDIIGHNEQISFLESIIETNRIFSSYLFLGPEAIGKKMVALDFAKALNCDFPDLHLIKPSGKGNTIKIEDIREIKRDASLKPYKGTYKVFIIDDAETMTQESQNALLKTLEETPSQTVFILITRSAHRILPTIISRCHIIKFKTIPIKEASNFLIQRYGMETIEALFLAKFSGGKIGKALKMKDSDAVKRKNLVIDRLLERNYPDRMSLKEDLTILLSWFRDIFISKVNCDKELLFNIDRIDEILKESDKLSLDDLETVINKVIVLNSYIDMNVNPKLVVDAVLSELALLEKESKCTK
ncbi:MAG: DNA polymerase III subunit delta' [Candidatus Omnitrophica bacterium]|nr:DNA polymerase III subunit delta' [Candidatus Omnitrophota bacterium]